MKNISNLHFFNLVDENSLMFIEIEEISANLSTAIANIKFKSDTVCSKLQFHRSIYFLKKDYSFQPFFSCSVRSPHVAPRIHENTTTTTRK